METKLETGVAPVRNQFATSFPNPGFDARSAKMAQIGMVT